MDKNGNHKIEIIWKEGSFRVNFKKPGILILVVLLILSNFSTVLALDTEHDLEEELLVESKGCEDDGEGCDDGCGGEDGGCGDHDDHDCGDDHDDDECGNGGRKGSITLKVEVSGLVEDYAGPVNITFIREEEEETVTVDIIDGVGTAVFTSKPSGTFKVIGQILPGYVMPEEMDIRLVGGNSIHIASYVYTKAEEEIPVEEVSLNKTDMQLVKGYPEKLIATVSPANANNQEVSWSSEYVSIAEVDNDGFVTPRKTGETIITATSSEDESIKDSCNVTVYSIKSLINPQDKQGKRNELIILPRSLEVKLDNDDTRDLPVIWKHQNNKLGYSFRIPLNGESDSYILKGYVEGYEQPAELNINVEQTDPAIPVLSVLLDQSAKSLIVGEEFQLRPTVLPVEATVKNLIWESSNPSVASVEDGNVEALSPGMTLITVTTLDGESKAYCIVSVGPKPEVSMIYTTATEYGSIGFTDFADIDEVYVNVENLASKLDEDQNAKYYIKIEGRGLKDETLGQGSIDIKKDTKTFKLTDKLTDETFKPTPKNNKQYKISMSTDDTFPTGEENTFVANFKLGLATPTIDRENIIITTEFTGAPDTFEKEGTIVLLCRELEEPSIEEITWEAYYKGTPPADPYGEGVDIKLSDFIDEVKVFGKVGEDGRVVWDEPKETIKIGGYYLLQITPNGFKDNLDLLNPESDDGEPMKVLHLERDDEGDKIFERTITSIYKGLDEEQSFQLNYSGINLTIGDESKQLQPIGEVEVTEWISEDEAIASVNEVGLVTAVAKGMTVIKATAEEGVAYCIVSVSEEPEPSLIFTVDEGNNALTLFENREDVYINVETLIEQEDIEEDTTYNIQVRVSGKNKSILGEGKVTINPNTTKFNLFNKTEDSKGDVGFSFACTNSKRYYVEMSECTDSLSPNKQEEPIQTNFSIGLATPTIPEEDIRINTRYIGGDREGSPGGTIFLLCRELDEPLIENITWEDYYKGTPPSDLYGEDVDIKLSDFIDEVKAFGKADAEGDVVWDKPKETLKLGGYILLQITPLGYDNNLNLINPESDEGELMKAVHLMRNDKVERNILNVYVGIEETPTVEASPGGGKYDSPQAVSLTPSQPAAIFYTTDGSDPKESPTKMYYFEPISIQDDTILKYVAVNEMGIYSEVYEEVYKIHIEIEDEETPKGDAELPEENHEKPGETEEPEKPEKPEKPEETDKSVGHKKLPQTGGIPSILFYGTGVGLTLIGSYIKRKENKK
jgi:LPXTG-motif cell wall-anchored protein